jgi:hypothetical protein
VRGGGVVGGGGEVRGGGEEVCRPGRRETGGERATQRPLKRWTPGRPCRTPNAPSSVGPRGGPAAHPTPNTQRPTPNAQNTQRLRITPSIFPVY